MAPAPQPSHPRRLSTRRGAKHVPAAHAPACAHIPCLRGGSGGERSPSVPRRTVPHPHTHPGPAFIPAARRGTTPHREDLSRSSGPCARPLPSSRGRPLPRGRPFLCLAVHGRSLPTSPRATRWASPSDADGSPAHSLGLPSSEIPGNRQAVATHPSAQHIHPAPTLCPTRRAQFSPIGRAPASGSSFRGTMLMKKTRHRTLTVTLSEYKIAGAA